MPFPPGGQTGLSAVIICVIAVRFRDSCATKGTKCTRLSGSFPNAENLSNVSTYACFLNVGCSEVILRLTLCSAFFCLSKLCIVYAALLSFEKGRMRKDDASALFEIVTLCSIPAHFSPGVNKWILWKYCYVLIGEHPRRCISTSNLLILSCVKLTPCSHQSKGLPLYWRPLCFTLLCLSVLVMPCGFQDDFL